MFKGNHTVKNTPLHKAVREAMVNMLSNADFYGRRGVVVQKNADGFKFANPGNIRVSLTEAVHDNMSDPRNGVMLKMLALVEYGERAGSGLQGIFSTWEKVFHTVPTVEVATGGVDRTTLILSYGGNQPDIQAMKLLYDAPDGIIIVDDTSESTQEKRGSSPESKGESTIENQSKGESTQEKGGSTPESKGESNGERVISLLRSNGELTLPAVAKILNLSLGGIEKIVRQLKREGRLVREGSTKAGRWIVKD